MFIFHQRLQYEKYIKHYCEFIVSTLNRVLWGALMDFIKYFWNIVLMSYNLRLIKMINEIYFLFLGASGRYPANAAIWLIPGPGGILVDLAHGQQNANTLTYLGIKIWKNIYIKKCGIYQPWSACIESIFVLGLEYRSIKITNTATITITVQFRFEFLYSA